jgi:hypothetical protein
MRPRCFSKAILYHGAPLPSTGSARAAFPGVISTIRALRLPAPITELLISFAPPLQPILSPVRSHAAERTAGPGPARARYRWLFSAGRTQELPGSWRTHPVPLPRSRIPASSSVLTLSARRCGPHFADNEDTGFTDLSRLNHAASVPAAYASSRTLPHAHARLASGRWLAFTGWESNPLDSFERFPSATSDFLLSQAYPGATAKVPQQEYPEHRTKDRWLWGLLPRSDKPIIKAMLQHMPHPPLTRVCSGIPHPRNLA